MIYIMLEPELIKDIKKLQSQQESETKRKKLMNVTPAIACWLTWLQISDEVSIATPNKQWEQGGGRER